MMGVYIMKIAVVASNGQVSQLIIKELLSRGHEVTGFARSANRSAAQNFVQKDILALTKEDLTGFDAVVSGFGVLDPALMDNFTKTSQHLADLVAGTDTRLYIVGGAGSLYVDATHKVQLFDTPDFPAELAPLARAHGAALDALRARKDAHWVYVSPAADFVEDGARTGKYKCGGEELTLSGAGESVISYADYTVGMADLIEKNDLSQIRVSLVQA